ncbi:TetR/AcrR family transcriptional regulator [Sinanaerobacter chloroacetimidivorans]|jgi:AcrR family transcriptional regulator|uniref:TetR/AcrR family transcriptional regulator n=1 Tax=Sinanaerobacter chloroacetimidivorans TaxID=2818044 RepID=A0A8J8B2Y4_9FIRM|nr:TetR/AcrR family transcriptional regulator [Sinanaerobacter chloroacetimidivorans]MBR0600323.1 TetR/AcrR family transcriptional regulator [Sinanaerobacter chloroacetimidivorans]
MKQTKKERTQKEIIEAAKDIIHDKGHEAVTVRYLAEVTGYSYTNLYYYFKDVNALLWTLRLDMIEDMITELTSISFKKDDPVEEILGAFFCYTDYFFKHPNVFRFFYFYPFVQPEGDDSYQKLEQRFHSMWQTSFIRLIQEGIIQTEDIEVVAKTIIYALQGMIMLSFSSNGATQKEDIKDELIKLVNYLFNKNKRNY